MVHATTMKTEKVESVLDILSRIVVVLPLLPLLSERVKPTEEAETQSQEYK